MIKLRLDNKEVNDRLKNAKNDLVLKFHEKILNLKTVYLYFIQFD